VLRIWACNGSNIGFRASYSDGKLIPLKQVYDAEPRPAAGNDGTFIQVDDLFYNVPSRRKAIRSGSDEYNKIVDVIAKYAIHNAGVAMVCKKVVFSFG